MHRRRPDAYAVQTSTKADLQKRMDSMLQACNSACQRRKQTPDRSNRKALSDGHLVRPESLLTQTTSNVAPQSLSIQSNRIPSASPLIKDNSNNGAASRMKKKSNGVDPMQNIYGRPSPRGASSPPVTMQSPRNMNTPPLTPKSILTKPCTSKNATGKRVRFNTDLLSTEPTHAYNTMESVNGSIALPRVEKKSSAKSRKVPLFQPPTRPTRPPLSEQLSAIANKASNITMDIKLKAGMDEDCTNNGEVPLLTFPVKNFTVGTLQCRFPSPAVFYNNRLEYVFHHPFQAAEIKLVLYYKDMQCLALSPNPQPGKMYFRVPRRLVHFASDYDPAKHFVVLFLSSSLSLQSLRNEILPVIAGLSGGSTMKF